MKNSCDSSLFCITLYIESVNVTLSRNNVCSSLNSPADLNKDLRCMVGSGRFRAHREITPISPGSRER